MEEIVNIAICLFGDKPCFGVDSELETWLNSLRNDNNILMFESCDVCVYKSIWLSSNLKRQHEIKAKIDFDLCIALHTSQLAEVNNIHILPKLQPDVLYFSNGGINLKTLRTRVCMNGMYSQSVTFDRVCEFIFYDTPYLASSDMIMEERFYYYVKSLNIRTECINYENSSLFKRAT
jgi:hypothetical protein